MQSTQKKLLLRHTSMRKLASFSYKAHHIRCLFICNRVVFVLRTHSWQQRSLLLRLFLRIFLVLRMVIFVVGLCKAWATSSIMRRLLRAWSRPTDSVVDKGCWILCKQYVYTVVLKVGLQTLRLEATKQHIFDQGGNSLQCRRHTWKFFG